MVFTTRSGMSRKRRILLLLVSLLAASVMPVPLPAGESPAIAAEPKTGPPAGRQAAGDPSAIEPYYASALKAWQDQGVPDATGAVTIRAAVPSARSDAVSAAPGSMDGKPDVLLWKGAEAGWIEYRFDVPAAGLYEIHASYRPLPGSGIGNPIVWDVALDGKRPFREASSITLYREWTDARPIVKNDDGDEVRPRSLELAAWRAKPFIDSEGAYAEPLKWYLAAGAHTIRLSGREPVALEELRLVPPQKIGTYAEVSGAYPSSAPVQANGFTLQAEDLSFKNDTSIKLFSDTDPRTVPVAKGRITYNTVGGRRWLYQNQEITWTFDVPETGKYKLALRTLQNAIAQKASFRRISIDGKTPFRELLDYRFPYSSDWKGTVLQSADGKPYEFYLKKGRHELSIAVNHAPIKPVLIGIDDLSGQLRRIEQDLRSLTGGLVDRNRTWKVAQELPDLRERLEKAAGTMSSLSAELQRINGGKDSVSQGLATSAQDIRTLLEKLDDVPYYADQITSMNQKISNFIDTLLQQPLQLDEIYIAPAEKKFPSMEASWISEAVGTVKNFFYSFEARDSLSKLNDRVLNVWVQRGRDYVDQLQQLADEQFTPETGIKVKVNLLPTPQLLVMSNAAGVQPDVALGLTQDLPVDYAIRGSVADLSKFPGFEEVQKRFSPGSWLPFYYNGGYYAVPETQSFLVLFYRKDILQQLGLKVPQTWDDVKEMLPALQRRSLNFYLNRNDYTPFFYQNRADFFEPSGLKTSLDSPQSFKSFKLWTDLFTTYAVEREVPSFYQHFRRGTMPIGVSDYNMYVQLAAAAPELTGRWGIAEIPGVKQPDGTIERWAGGGQRTGVIFEASKKKDQAWAFLKWWVSADVQARYGNDIEAVNGPAFRWNTSNVEAFVKLPWRPEDARVILEQWRWYKDVPNLPGGYFLERELKNAWLRSVVDGMNYRSSLETAVLDVNRELRRKQQEFGFVDAGGAVVKTLRLPEVSKPWEGVDAYVR
ncbi:extracellular solute-binding protein [Paenibacillus hamazuiensis]|uniref:extracellular solute-binding protein n=1 Tax=Paenibacillus hamazuiensis TaxID=2936508 RepID=UPI00200E9BC0|nr:extracellular solute-binding protein [Paenibacillus hamazuiensis]